jgi:hypothetical protein
MHILCQRHVRLSKSQKDREYDARLFVERLAHVEVTNKLSD